jgi:hypothetical protein
MSMNYNKVGSPIHEQGPNSLENSSIEKPWPLNQQLSKILVVHVSYVSFTAPMTFCALSMLMNS